VAAQGNCRAIGDLDTPHALVTTAMVIAEAADLIDRRACIGTVALRVEPEPLGQPFEYYSCCFSIGDRAGAQRGA